MNKVKKAIAALKTYLGSDTYGQELLVDVSNAANEIRKSLAAKCSECEQLSEAKRTQWTPDALLGECETLRENVRQTEAQLKQARSRIAILEQQLADALAEPPEEPSKPMIISENRVADIMNNARRHKPVPRPRGICVVKSRCYKDMGFNKGESPRVWVVQDFISKQVTDEDLWYLGASVFLLAGISRTVVMHSSINLQDYNHRISGKELERWGRDMIDWSINESEVNVKASEFMIKKAICPT